MFLSNSEYTQSSIYNIHVRHSEHLFKGNTCSPVIPGKKKTVTREPPVQASPDGISHIPPAAGVVINMPFFDTNNMVMFSSPVSIVYYYVMKASVRNP